jgi:ribose transport system substrate-binding protein
MGWALALTTILGAMVLAGCVEKVEETSGSAATSPAATASGGGEAKYRVGVTLLNRVHNFYSVLEETMVAEAEARGIELIVQDGDFDSSKQKNQIEDFIVQEVDAIIVCPVDSASIGGPIGMANEAGIPVFTADIGADEGEVVAHIATDNVMGGRLAGEFLAEQIGGEGKVVILDHPSVMSVQDRTTGFEAAMAEYPGTEIVDRPAADGVRDKANDRMQDMLTKYPDLAGVFAINDDTALGALAAIRQSTEPLEDLVMVGFDGTDEALEEIAAGSHLKADVVQYPTEIAKQTIDAVHTYLEGDLEWAPGDPTLIIPIEPELVTAGDLPLE